MGWQGEPITRVRREVSGTDAHGNPSYADVEATIEGGWLAPEKDSREPRESGRDAVVTSPALFFPGARPDLRADDKVIVRGEKYEVEGDPSDWRDPFGSDLGGLVVTLRRAEG